ncbi:cytidylyltransferase domain-containing protein [Gracilimonas sp.]|uniref:acylneuraminate cytidylyltransferase family protein n=1 Tax=Gracilimonas sp. TaxID=1974203 RepID=UPI003D0AEE47
MVNKKRVAIIPARGGSKRIPKKNIIDFLGKPMIAYTIEAAIASNCFEDIIVSTDDQEIADVSVQYGAKVPFLREQYADDHSTISQATVHTLQKLSSELSENYESVVQLMANCPIRNSEDIIEACNFFDDNVHNFQISAFKFGWMNPWWAHKLEDNFTATPVFDDEIRNRRSQDQPDLYCPTGAIWIANVEKLKDSESFYGDSYRFFPIDWKSAMDIDDTDDLEFAKVLMKHKYGK